MTFIRFSVEIYKSNTYHKNERGTQEETRAGPLKTNIHSSNKHKFKETQLHCTIGQTMEQPTSVSYNHTFSKLSQK